MATPVSDTSSEGEVRLEVEKPLPRTEVHKEMDDDSAGKGDVLLDIQEGPSHAEASEETSGDTTGGGDNHRQVEPEPSSQAETNEKVDYILVYETWQENEAGDEDTQKKTRDHREKFEKNLDTAGLKIIGRKDTAPSPVSTPSLFFENRTYILESSSIYFSLLSIQHKLQQAQK